MVFFLILSKDDTGFYWKINCCYNEWEKVSPEEWNFAGIQYCSPGVIRRGEVRYVH